jgi:hypothetical protein
MIVYCWVLPWSFSADTEESKKWNVDQKTLFPFFPTIEQL